MDELTVSPDGASVLVSVSALCTVLSVLLRWRLGPAPRVVTGVLSLVLLLITGGAAVVPFLLRETPGALGSAPFQTKLYFSLGVFFPSLWIAGGMLVRGIRHAGDAYLHHANADLRRTYDYGKARAKERGGDYDGAVAAFREYFEANPSIPEPLYAAAQLLIQRRRYREAELLFEEIRRRFGRNSAVWCEATYRLANLFDVEVGDRPAAAALFRDLIRRDGSTEQARLAAERLLRHTTQPNGGA